MGGSAVSATGYAGFCLTPGFCLVLASPWSTRTGNSRAVPVISDQHFIEAALQSRLLSDNLESFPGYEHYPPWLLQLLSLDQDTQMQLLARLPKRDSPSLATRQAGSKVKGVIPYPRIGKRSQQTSVGNAVIPYPRVGRSSPDYY